jgi:hypothetical protein
MYLHVTTISELLDASGARLRLLPHMLKCQRPPWFNPKTITVIQARPTSRPCLRQWQELCHKLATMVPNIGQWTESSRPLRLRREAYTSIGAPTEYHHWHAGCYWQCSLLDQQRALCLLKEPSDWLPDAMSFPVASIARIRETVYLVLNIASPSPTINQSGPVDFPLYIQLQPAWEQRLLEHMDWEVPPFWAMHLLHSINFNTVQLIVVSDRSSFEADTMSFGIAISTTTGALIIPS